MASKFIVYGLIDPRSKLIRYVGKSATGLLRMRHHRKPSAANARTYCARWIKKLRQAGHTFEVVVLEFLESATRLNELERYWIAFGRACGWPLTNLTDGGDGASVGHVVTTEQRENLAKLSRARWADPRKRAKNKKALKGSKTSEGLARIAEASRKRWSDPAYRRRTSAAIRSGMR